MTGSVVLDASYLSRQTFGDLELERDLLTLFREQCRQLRPLMDAARSARGRSEAAHTLRGAAHAVGAREIADRLDRLEAAISVQSDAAAGLLPSLDRALAAAEAAISARLATLSCDTERPGDLAKAARLA